jgi:TonB family protein
MTAIRLLVAVCAIGATLATPRAQEPQRPGNGVTAPTVVKRVNPEYTQEALAERIEGVVGLSIVVRPDGSVGDVEVTKSLDSGSAASDSGRILTATVRSRRVSRALYTSPIPPAPRADRIS